MGPRSPLLEFLTETAAPVVRRISVRAQHRRAGWTKSPASRRFVWVCHACAGRIEKPTSLRFSGPRTLSGKSRKKYLMPVPRPLDGWQRATRSRPATLLAEESRAKPPQDQDPSRAVCRAWSNSFEPGNPSKDPAGHQPKSTAPFRTAKSPAQWHAAEKSTFDEEWPRRSQGYAIPAPGVPTIKRSKASQCSALVKPLIDVPLTSTEPAWPCSGRK